MHTLLGEGLPLVVPLLELVGEAAEVPVPLLQRRSQVRNLLQRCGGGARGGGGYRGRGHGAAGGQGGVSWHNRNRAPPRWVGALAVGNRSDL